MKDISQLLELRKNPYYQFSPEEEKAIKDFLAKNSDTQSRQKQSGKNSETSTRAIAHNKNRVQKEVGDVPVINTFTEKHSTEVAQVEESVHPDAVKWALRHVLSLSDAF